ncbi:MAG TPA: hypothetical protein VG096_10455, partial [Bryobacteraceae bacterium]|nr:hypothetical protein [Bryobacteraceae bacterium]
MPEPIIWDHLGSSGGKHSFTATASSAIIWTGTFPRAAPKKIASKALIFGKLAEMWRADFVEREVGGRALIAASTRAKYINHLGNHILPRWKD